MSTIPKTSFEEEEKYFDALRTLVDSGEHWGLPLFEVLKIDPAFLELATINPSTSERLRSACEFIISVRGDGFSTSRKPIEFCADKSAPQYPDEIIVDPANPRAIARELRDRKFWALHAHTLLFSSETFYEWNGLCYTELQSQGIREKIYRFLESAYRQVKLDDGSKGLAPLKPKSSLVNDVLDALKALCFTTSNPNCWLIDGDDVKHPLINEIITAKNGVVNLAADEIGYDIYKPTPLLFSVNALSYEYRRNARKPTTWLHFLNQLWPDDSESMETLQEWFGYVLSHDTSLQKILLIAGPPRSGKGTIARILTAMIGADNVCGPTLDGIGTNFGLWQLLNKQLAIISDARLSGRTNQAVVTERLLSISGEDFVTVDIKNRQPQTVKLPTRLMILTNELPRISDSSGALANRFIILKMNKSFLGEEDHDLTNKLLAELPGILLWAIKGWKRLRQRGRFVQPASSSSSFEEILELASPVSAFVREWCTVSSALSVDCQDLYDAWRFYCKEQGNRHPDAANIFGRNLRSAFPTIGDAKQRRNSEGKKVRYFPGIGLTVTAAETLAVYRANEAPM